MIEITLHLMGLLGALALFLFAGDSLVFVSPLATWTLLLLVFFTLGRAKMPSFFSLFALCYGLLFLLYPSIRPVLPVVVEIEPALFTKYTFLAVTGCHLFMAGYAFGSFGRGKGVWADEFKVDKSRLLRVLAVLLLINLLAVSMKIVTAGSLQAVLSQSRRELKTGYGMLNVVSIYLGSVGAFFFPLVAAIVFRKRRLIPVVLVMVLVLEFLFLVIYRTRTSVVMHMIGLVLGWFFIGEKLNWGDEILKKTRFTVRRLLPLVMVLFLVGMSGLMIRSLRGQFEVQSGGREITVDPWKAAAFGFQTGELNYSTPVMRVLDQIPDHYDHMHGQSYYRLLFVFVPRSVWPDKPHNSQRILARIIRPTADEVQTIPAGVIGDLYANFSYWGIFGMFIFGWIFRALDRGSGTAAALFLSVSFAMIFHFVRGGFTNPITTLFVFWVVALLIAKYIESPAGSKGSGLEQVLISSEKNEELSG